MKFLVSGSGGFVGNVLVRYLLNNGYEVRAMDNFHKGQCDALLGVANDPKFEFLYGDVSSKSDCEKAIKDVDVVIHLAAIVGFPACARQPALAKAVNVDGTKNMLEVSKGLPFVFASTGSVYGKVEGICTEESPLNTTTIYGLTKLSAERMVTEQDNTVSFRFATGFGLSPCMRVNLLVNDFVYRAKTEGCLVVFQADFRRTFIHVYDMARTLTAGGLRLAQRDLGHKVYNAGADHLNWTKRELAEYISQKTGCLVHYAEIGTDADQRDYEVDYSRWANELGYSPVTYSMEDGIEELLRAISILQIRHQYE